MVNQSHCDRPNRNHKLEVDLERFLASGTASTPPPGLFDPEAGFHAYHSLMHRIRRHMNGIKGRFKPGKQRTTFYTPHASSRYRQRTHPTA